MRLPFWLLKRDYALESLTVCDGVAIAQLHHEDCVRSWSAEEFSSLLEQGTVFGFAVREVGQSGAVPTDCVLTRLAVGEAEILMITVSRSHRRCSLGWRLMNAVLRALHRQRAEALFLEVDETNAPAIGFYRQFGFHKVGKHPNYYCSAQDATGVLIMRLYLR